MAFNWSGLAGDVSSEGYNIIIVLFLIIYLPLMMHANGHAVMLFQFPLNLLRND